MHSLIFSCIINYILLSRATVCSSYYTDEAFNYMQSDDGGGAQYLVEPKFDGDCISVSYSIYDIHNNNNNNTIVFYTNDIGIICQNYCSPVFNCANIIDGKINVYYYTSYNESFSYSQKVKYDECHMDDGEILLTVVLSVIFGGAVIVITIIYLSICLCPVKNPQENPEENPEENRKENPREDKIENTTLENTDDDSNMVELDLSI